MNKINDRLTKLVQNHPVASVLTVSIAGYGLGALAGHYLAKGIVKAASGNRIL